jgi:hypothetical protein
MESRSPRPPRLAISEVVREAARAYRANASPLLLTAVIVFIPVGLLEAVAHSLEHLEVEHATAAAIAGLVGAGLVIGITATLGDVFYTGVVAALVAERRTGVRRELAHIARNLPYLRLIAVDAIFALAVAFGVVLLVVPGLVVFTWYVLAAPVVEIEGRGVRDAFRRSRALVRGNFWPVLGLLGPIVIISDELANLALSGEAWVIGDGFFGDWLGAVLTETITVPLFALAAVVTAHHLISGAAPGAPRTPPPSRRRAGREPAP